MFSGVWTDGLPPSTELLVVYGMNGEHHSSRDWEKPMMGTGVQSWVLLFDSSFYRKL